MRHLYIILLFALIITPALADNVTIITPIPTSIPTTMQTGYIPTPTPIPTSTPEPIVIPTHYISQGEIVYINDTIDISGVVAPYPQLAYWNGRDMYNTSASYIITLPHAKAGYYHFYIDPSIFETRTGKWYKYDGTYETHGNNIAFVVYPQSYRNSTMTYSNGTIVNISELIINNYTDIEIPISPPVEIKHISDYLVARGDPFVVKTNATTNIWLFGRVDKLLDFKSTNSTLIDISKDVLTGFEPGTYTVMLQTINERNSKFFTVIYDNTEKEIKWFDLPSFSIKSLDINGLSPKVILEKFWQITPETMDTFKTYSMEYQLPTIEIQSVSEKLTPNETINQAGVVEYNTNVSYIQVKGYTNVAIGSPLKFIIDEQQQDSKTLESHTTIAVTAGSNNPGDMRWFDVTIPVYKYNMWLGDHTVTAYTNLSTGGTVYTFVIYSAPLDAYIPPKTIRYISGEYGPEEFIPTPTPIIQNVTVTVPGPTQIVTVKVTPSDEQIKTQQKIIADENIKKWATRIIIGAIIIGVVWYLISIYLRRKELK
ncbi:MAG: DUF3821 domain-containing protein [Candidatus Paceibacterota bacterium]|jgi:hypothetical protein